MSNFVEKVGHGIEVAAEDVVKGAEFVLTDGEKVIKIISEVKQLSPAFKVELQALIDDVKPIALALAPVIASGGKNVIADVAAVEPVISDLVHLVSDFVSFIPTIEAALKSLESAAS